MSHAIPYSGMCRVISALPSGAALPVRTDRIALRAPLVSLQSPKPTETTSGSVLRY
jgi:hypothetical protein